MEWNPLGGGHLIGESEKAFNFVKNIPFIHSFAIGMQSKEEIDANVSLVETGFVAESLKESLRKKRKES